MAAKSSLRAPRFAGRPEKVTATAIRWAVRCAYSYSGGAFGFQAKAGSSLSIGEGVNPFPTGPGVKPIGSAGPQTRSTH
jgi:hypothetical protein